MPLTTSIPTTTTTELGLTEFSFNGNPALKPAGVKMELTPEQIEEFAKCADDPLYFIENYVKIINLDTGITDFKPYPYQRKMIKKFAKHRFVIVKACRQSGKCFSLNTLVRIKNPRTGEIYELTAEQLYAWLCFKRQFKAAMSALPETSNNNPKVL